MEKVEPWYLLQKLLSLSVSIKDVIRMEAKKAATQKTLSAFVLLFETDRICNVNYAL